MAHAIVNREDIEYYVENSCEASCLISISDPAAGEVLILTLFICKLFVILEKEKSSRISIRKYVAEFDRCTNLVLGCIDRS